MSSSAWLSFVLSLLFSITIDAQLLVPLHGACTSSVQCIGVAICVQQVCQCPPVYAAIGITCIYSGAEFPMEPPGFALPVPAPLPAAVAAGPLPNFFGGGPMHPGAGPMHPGAGHMHPGPAPALPIPAPAVPVPVPPVAGAAVSYAYPGANCNAGKVCVGGSFCYQGSCGCPSGYIVSGYSCMQHNIIEAAPAPIAAPLPPVPVPAPIFSPGPEPVFPGPISQALPSLPGPTFFGQISESFFPRANNFGPDFLPAHGPAPAPSPAFGPFPGGPLPLPMVRGGPQPCPNQQVLIGSSCLPQAVVSKLPAGILCTNGVGCTGGSSCVNSVCTCPSNHVWGSTGCVSASRPGPAFPYAPVPFAPAPAVPVAHSIPAAPLQMGPAMPAFPVPDISSPMSSLVTLGASCSSHSQCVAGAFCQLGVCACRPSYVPYGSVCILRRHKAKEEAERGNKKKE